MRLGAARDEFKRGKIGERMQTVIIVIHLMVVAAMIGVVLLQKSEGGGLGIGSTGGFLSSRGTANVLTRTTAILAATFFATSLVLSVLAGWDRKPRSIIQNTGSQPQQTPSGPLGQGGGVLDTLRQQEQSPPPPSGPQVPRSQ
jgi:preprotein translocase subunit SecG